MKQSTVKWLMYGIGAFSILLGLTTIYFLTPSLNANTKNIFAVLSLGFICLLFALTYGIRSFFRAQFNNLLFKDYMRDFSAEEDTLFESAKSEIDELYETKKSLWVGFWIFIAAFGIPMITLANLVGPLENAISNAKTDPTTGLLWQEGNKLPLALILAILPVSFFLLQLSVAIFSVIKNKPHLYLMYKPHVFNTYGKNGFIILSTAIKRDLKHFIRLRKIRPDAPFSLKDCLDRTVFNEIILRMIYVLIIIGMVWGVQQYDQSSKRALYTNHIISNGDFFTSTPPQKTLLSELDKVILTCRTYKDKKHGGTRYIHRIKFYHDSELILATPLVKSLDKVAKTLNRHDIPIRIKTDKKCRDGLKKKLESYSPRLFKQLNLD